MRNAECGMWNVECGMRNVECGMWNAERQANETRRKEEKIYSE
jgi:hypothetical protein